MKERQGTFRRGGLDLHGPHATKNHFGGYVHAEQVFSDLDTQEGQGEKEILGEEMFS